MMISPQSEYFTPSGDGHQQYYSGMNTGLPFSYKGQQQMMWPMQQWVPTVPVTPMPPVQQVQPVQPQIPMISAVQVQTPIPFIPVHVSVPVAPQNPTVNASTDLPPRRQRDRRHARPPRPPKKKHCCQEDICPAPQAHCEDDECTLPETETHHHHHEKRPCDARCVDVEDILKIGTFEPVKKGNTTKENTSYSWEWWYRLLRTKLSKGGCSDLEAAHSAINHMTLLEERKDEEGESMRNLRSQCLLRAVQEGQDTLVAFLLEEKHHDHCCDFKTTLPTDTLIDNDDTIRFSMLPNDLEEESHHHSHIVDLEFMGSQGETALYNAARLGYIDIAKMLIRAGANIEASNNRGYSCLGVAAMRGLYPMVQYLLSEGADPNHQNKRLETVVTTASIRGYMNIVKLLVEAEQKKKNDGGVA